MVAMSNTVAWIIVGALFSVIYIAGFLTNYIYRQIRGES